MLERGLREEQIVYDTGKSTGSDHRYSFTENVLAYSLTYLLGHFFMFKTRLKGNGEMARQLRALRALARDLCLILSTHKVAHNHS